MFCDNCGNEVDNESMFCSRCGNQVTPGKVPPNNIPRPRRSAIRSRRHDQDFLCFGDETRENPYIGGIVLMCIGIFLAVLFFFPGFPIEYLIPVAFVLIGAIVIMNARK